MSVLCDSVRLNHFLLYSCNFSVLLLFSCMKLVMHVTFMARSYLKIVWRVSKNTSVIEFPYAGMYEDFQYVQSTTFSRTIPRISKGVDRSSAKLSPWQYKMCFQIWQTSGCTGSRPNFVILNRIISCILPTYYIFWFLIKNQTPNIGLQSNLSANYFRFLLNLTFATILNFTETKGL